MGSGMTPAATTRAVLFADLVGSTRLYHALGDWEAHGIAAGCLAGIIETVGRLGGTVVKTIGDEVMATFPTAAAACSCAEAIVLGMRASGVGRPEPLGVHVGFHYGPVIEEDQDVFGDTVNVAAYVVKMAERQCILTTAPTAELLDERVRARMRPVERVAIKGRLDPVDVLELTTGNETLIRFAEVRGSEPTAAREPSLTLSYGRQRRELRGRHRSLTIGRDESNDLVLSSPSASRFHARIEWRGRGFYLVDRSTNGTLVVSDSGRVRTLRREWLRIHGSGTFGIVASGSGPEEPIRFECRDTEAPADPDSTSSW
jgi:adenylate cyclase